MEEPVKNVKRSRCPLPFNERATALSMSVAAAVIRINTGDVLEPLSSRPGLTATLHYRGDYSV